MTIAPIAIFAYQRPSHLREMLETLKQNPEVSDTVIYAFSDGPKPDASDALRRNIAEVRNVLSGIDWCKKLIVIEAEANKGLATSLIDGVSRVLDEHGRVIVLEDDLILSANFLTYMNSALEKYKDDQAVYQISGYMFSVDFGNIDADCMLLPYTTTWGWGSWKRAWDRLDISKSGFERLSQDRKLRKAFDMNGTYPYYEMLKMQTEGRISSWGIDWYKSVFLNQGLTLHPRKTLVIQNGFDEQATHTHSSSGDYLNLYSDEMMNGEIKRFPERTAVSDDILSKYISFFRRHKRQRAWFAIKKLAKPYILYDTIRKKLIR